MAASSSSGAKERAKGTGRAKGAGAADGPKSSVFMFGATKKELQGIRGYPRRYRFNRIGHDEMMKMFARMKSQTLPCDDRRALEQMIEIMGDNPDTYLDVTVSETEDDAENVTYEPTDEDLQRDEIKYQEFLDFVAKEKKRLDANGCPVDAPESQGGVVTEGPSNVKKTMSLRERVAARRRRRNQE